MTPTRVDDAARHELEQTIEQFARVPDGERADRIVALRLDVFDQLVRFDSKLREVVNTRTAQRARERAKELAVAAG